jgi:hypothetical protein
MFVSIDGDYGTNELHTFEYGKLTEKQWDLVAELEGLDRYIYIQAILEGDDRTVHEYEEA